MDNLKKKNWRLECDEKNILWLIFDKQDSGVNTIDLEVLDELSAILDSLENDHTHLGLIISSAKKSGFIAGADIEQFKRFCSMEDAIQMLQKGQHIYAKLAHLKMPTLALIKGFCLGGGLELALACNYIIAEDRSRLGLPEVKLGIIPGWGGTIRLVSKIGALSALPMIISAQVLSAKAAAKLGIVDAVVPERQLVHAAHYFIKHMPPRKTPSLLHSLINHRFIRQFIAHWMRQKLSQKVNALHYPAPFEVLNNWELMGVTHQQAYEREAKSCGKLFLSETSQNLIHVFFLQNRLKSLAKESSFQPKHVHVIGAGTMGGDIAAWCALQGLKVSLQDLQPALIARAVKRAYTLFKERLKEAHLVQQAADRLIPDIAGYGLAHADVIIEAVAEDLAIKQTVFKTIEATAKPQALIATNTSSIPIDEINQILQEPSRLIGIHFFNPVAKMQLVEIVKGKQSAELAINQAMSFVRRIDRLPLPVNSSPGFLVNRILMPYLLEAVMMLDEGIPARAIDQAMLNFGMPMGPITLADTVGLDICYSVAKYLSQYFQTVIPKQLGSLVAQKKLGKKSGEGFYAYDNKGKHIKTTEPAYSQALEPIAERLVLTMLNEAFCCLQEGVVADSDLLDAGMIFGTGFAPFRGGPIHYAKLQGISSLYQQFVRHKQQRGESWEQHRTWDEIVC